MCHNADRPAPSALPSAPTGLSAIADSSLVPYSSFAMTGQPAGRYIAMDTAGEKVVTASVSTGGYSYFATNMPSVSSDTSCASNLGTAKTWQVPLFCGVPATQEIAGGGLPPTPVTGYVDVSYPDPNNPGQTQSKTVPFIIGGMNAVHSGIGASRVPINVDPTRRRTFWFTNTNR